MEPPSLIKGGGGIESLGGGRVQHFLLEMGDKPEKGRRGGGFDVEMGALPLFLLLYSSVTFTLHVGKVKFPLLLQDSHPSLCSTKTLYHLYISDPFW